MISTRFRRLLTLAVAGAGIACGSALAAPGDIEVTRIDVVPGSVGSGPTQLEAIGDTVFFAADDGINGTELWKSEGTSATRIDVFPGSDSSYPSELTNVDGTLFFRARDALNEEELWKLEPPYEIPTKIDVNPNPDEGSSPEGLVDFNGTLFFAAYGGTAAGRELWKSNGGTVASGGTVMVADMNPTPNESTFPESLTPVGTTLFFVARDGVDNEELWKTNGTVGDKTKLEINPAVGEGSDPSDLVNVAGVLFLTAENGTVGRELFRAAPADTAATPIDIAPGPTGSDPGDLAPLGGTVFLNADDGSAAGAELWKSNGGTVASGGTAMVDDINPSGDSFPEELIPYNGALYFDADDGGGAGFELWKTNGGPVGAGTEMVADIQPGPGNSNPSDGVVFDGRLWFRATTSAAGSELWNVDSADAAHTADIAPGMPSSNPAGFTPAVGALFLAADDGGSVNRELWKATAEPSAPPPSGGGAPAITPSPAPPMPKAKKKCKKKKHRAAAAKKKCKKKRK